MSQPQQQSKPTKEERDEEEEAEPQGSLLRQTLLTHDEVFVYKIPPLRSSGGHRYVIYACLF